MQVVVIHQLGNAPTTGASKASEGVRRERVACATSSSSEDDSEMDFVKEQRQLNSARKDWFITVSRFTVNLWMAAHGSSHDDAVPASFFGFRGENDQDELFDS